MVRQMCNEGGSTFLCFSLLEAGLCHLTTAHQAAPACALTRLSQFELRFAPFPCFSQLLSSASEGADSYQSQILDAAETALFNSQTASNADVLTTLANMTSLVVCASTFTGFWALGDCLTKHMQTNVVCAASGRWPAKLPAPSVRMAAWGMPV